MKGEIKEVSRQLLCVLCRTSLSVNCVGSRKEKSSSLSPFDLSNLTRTSCQAATRLITIEKRWLKKLFCSPVGENCSVLVQSRSRSCCRSRGRSRSWSRMGRSWSRSRNCSCSCSSRRKQPISSSPLEVAQLSQLIGKVTAAKASCLSGLHRRSSEWLGSSVTTVNQEDWIQRGGGQKQKLRSCHSTDTVSVHGDVRSHRVSMTEPSSTERSDLTDRVTETHWKLFSQTYLTRLFTGPHSVSPGTGEMSPFSSGRGSLGQR